MENFKSILVTDGFKTISVLWGESGIGGQSERLWKEIEVSDLMLFAIAKHVISVNITS
jgi:hypothetical protein